MRAWMRRCSSARARRSARGARVGNAVIGADAFIGAGAEVVDAVVLDGGQVEPATKVHRGVVGPHGLLAAGPQ